MIGFILFIFLLTGIGALLLYTNKSASAKQIKEVLRFGSNIRIGTEWRFGPFSVRGGFAHYSSPYTNEINNASTLSYSFGAGFVERKLFFDFAFFNTISNERYYIYNSTDALAILDKLNRSFSLTVGYRY